MALTASASAADWRPTQLDNYFGPEDGAISAESRAALELAKRWQGAGFNGGNVTAGPDGLVRFLFGSGQPVVVCAVLQVCDIELQPGETVHDVKAGDKVRWIIEPAFSGMPGAEITHVTVKPTEPGLDTQLVVLTTKRTYHIKLRSTKTEYLPHVGFIYPEEASAQWQTARKKAEAERKVNTIKETGEYLGNLDFNYRVTGDAAWKPVRVYNDGRKTIIQMPEEMGRTEAPALLLLRQEGDLFNDEETGLVNYRLQGDRYVVDAVFDRAILVAGAGSTQDRITIERRSK